MIGSINGWEWIILVVVVLVVVGPERLPQFAAQLGRVVREVRRIATGARERVKEEVGDDLDELRNLDPRRYDPRRIIQDALNDDEPVTRAATARPGGGAPRAASVPRTTTPTPDAVPPFDDQAT